MKWTLTLPDVYYITATELLLWMSEPSTATLEELKDRFADYLNERTKGKDKAKVRLVLE